MDRVLKSADGFAVETPQLNIKGQTKVGTICGSIVTLSILILTLVFALSNTVELVHPVSPSIITTTIPNGLAAQKYLSLG